MRKVILWSHTALRFIRFLRGYRKLLKFVNQRFNFRRFNSRLFWNVRVCSTAVVLSTFGSRFKDSKWDGEVGGDGEGNLLLEWYLDLDLPFTVWGPPSSAKYVEALKIGSTTRGIPTQSGPWLTTPFPFGIVGLTGDMGPVSQFMCVFCVEIWYLIFPF